MTCSSTHSTAGQPNKPSMQMPAIAVNGVSISEQAIAEELQYHPADNAELACYQAASALVIRELLLQQVSKLEQEQLVDFSDAALAAESDSNLKEVPDLKEVSDLKEASDNNEEAKISLLLEQQVTVPNADEAACKGYYDNNPSKFTTTPTLEVSHILLAAPPADDAKRKAMRALAEQLITQLENNTGLFARLAAEHSICPSKDQSGSLGALTRGQTVAEFERQVFALPKGLAQHPIESRYGYHIVCVDRREEGQPIPFNTVRNKIASFLEAQVRRRAVRHYLLALIAESEIKGIELDKVDSPLMQ